MEAVRATEVWQQAAAYYVRIDSMVKGFNIPADIEIDGHDKPDTKYIVVFDGILPVATCRLYFEEGGIAKIERVVVTESLRNKGVGRLAVEAAEEWIKELGYKKIVITSRDEAVGFYEKLGYTADYSRTYDADIFKIIYTEKNL